MECPDENALVAMIEGDLDPAEREAVDAHIDTCPTCAALVIELAHVLTPGDPDAAPTPKVAPAQAGHADYTLGELLGHGGMGMVYAARHEALERRVAIKLLRADMSDPDMRAVYTERLLREARVVASLSHPNIITIFDVGLWRADQVFLAMELIEGDTLRGWLKAEPRGWREVLGVYKQAAAGLSHAHQRGIIHRDVKPENMLIGRDGRVRVTDFGLARAQAAPHPTPTDAAQVSSVSGLTKTGDIMGTPAYMAPEQHLGADVDEAADQFALCVAIWEALCGQRPFAGESRQALSMEVCAGRVQPTPPDVEAPAALFDVLRRGLSPAPRSRWPSLDALVAEIDAACEPRRRSLAVPIALAVAAALVAALALPGLMKTSPTTAPVEAPAPSVVLPRDPVEDAALPVAPASEVIRRALATATAPPAPAGLTVTPPAQRDAVVIRSKPKPKPDAPVIANPALPGPAVVATSRTYRPRPDAPRFEALLDAMADGRVTWLEDYMEVARRGFAEGNGSGCINALSLSFAMLETRDIDRSLLEGECLLLSGQCRDGEQTLRAAYKMSTMSSAEANAQAKAARAARCNEDGPPGAFRSGVPVDPRREKRLLQSLRGAEGVVDGVQLFP
jgi:tRNA A-37 threonylcarbamoyl transferase component Bud32